MASGQSVLIENSRFSKIAGGVQTIPRVRARTAGRTGLPLAAALLAAPIHGAMALKEDQRLGTIEEEKSADLVLLDTNPLLDIRNALKIHMIIRSGQLLRPSDLLRRVSKD